MKASISTIEIEIPEIYQKMKSLPNDPSDSVSYGMQNDNTMAFMLIFPIEPEQAMPLHAPQIIIDSIHGFLKDNQGLISVFAGKTRGGKKYAYSIVKSAKQPSGIQYILTFQIQYPSKVLNIQAFYDEIGMTGLRDSIVYEIAAREGKVILGTFDGWMNDPYDPDYKKGLRMNLSESEEYDKMFPNHPLSVLRRFIQAVKRHN